MNDLNKTIATLELDKCYTDKERAAVLQKEMARREAELNPIKETYRNVYGRIVDEWYNEFATIYPDLAQQLFKRGDEMWVVVYLGEIRYEIKIENDRKVLYNALWATKSMSVEMIRKFEDLMSRRFAQVALFEHFGINDFDAAFSHFCKLVERFLELQKAASKVEEVE